MAKAFKTLNSSFLSEPKVVQTKQKVIIHDSPITKVILFKTGLAYFERSVQVDAGQSRIDLLFPRRDLQDALKTLNIVDLSGEGVINSVSFPNPDFKTSYDFTSPSTVKNENALSIEDLGSVSSLLYKFQNLKKIVRLHFKNEFVDGMVLSIVKERADKQVISENTLQTTVLQEEFQTVILLQEDILHKFPIHTIERVEILDEEMIDEVQKLVERQKEEREELETREKRNQLNKNKENTCALSIFVSGTTNGRTVCASYILNSSVWKTSYRVNYNNTTKKIEFDGWGIIDNNQSEDWSNVNLSLISGLPFSFLFPLTQPHHHLRPEVRFSEQQYTFIKRQFDQQQLNLNPINFSEFGNLETNNPQFASFVSNFYRTKVHRTAEGYVYDIKHPVTVKRNESALVKIVNEEINGSKIWIYNKMMLSSHPLNALWIKNQNVPLPSGPVLIFEDSNTYLGECLMEHLSPSANQILPYSVQLSSEIHVLENFEYGLPEEVFIKNSEIGFRYWMYRSWTYEITNRSTDQDIQLLIQHPRLSNGKLLTKKYLLKEKNTFYTFFISLSELKKECDENSNKISFSVKEKCLSVKMIKFGHFLNSEIIKQWEESKYINSKIKERLEDISDKLNEIKEKKKNFDSIAENIKALFMEYNRQKNELLGLGEIEEHSALRQTFVNSLIDIEKKFSTLRQEIELAFKSSIETEVTVKDYLKSLEHSWILSPDPTQTCTPPDYKSSFNTPIYFSIDKTIEIIPGFTLTHSMNNNTTPLNSLRPQIQPQVFQPPPKLEPQTSLTNEVLASKQFSSESFEENRFKSK